MAMLEHLPDGNIRIRVDYMFCKRGNRKKILLQESDSGLLAENRNMSVLTSIARARRWQRYIDEGRFYNIQELAYVLKLDRSYVARTIRLAHLSPRIVRLFLQGKEPFTLNLSKLIVRMPDDWNEQEKLLGLAV